MTASSCLGLRSEGGEWSPTCLVYERSVRVGGWWWSLADGWEVRRNAGLGCECVVCLFAKGSEDGESFARGSGVVNENETRARWLEWLRWIMRRHVVRSFGTEILWTKLSLHSYLSSLPPFVDSRSIFQSINKKTRYASPRSLANDFRKSRTEKPSAATAGR